MFGAAGALALAGGLAWRWRDEAAAQAELAPADLWTARWPRPDGSELALASWRGRPNAWRQ
jgi:hypothetical protein